MAKKVRVRHNKKLGRYKADARTYMDGRGIWIDERLKGKRAMAGLVHDLIHYALPNSVEEEVLRIEEQIMPTLWAELKKHPEKYLKGIIK